MSWTIPLPGRTARLAAQNTHAGLLLDKYAASWNERPGNEKFSEKVQRETAGQVARLSTNGPRDFDYHRLFVRHQHSRPQAATFRAMTDGPLTMQLARASALENAGICLHPIYGFAYLSGSGLKGMAHAYACEVWLPTRPERESGWQQICDIFGTAPVRWLAGLAERLNFPILQFSRAGSIVFHDAWPLGWPELLVDIVNNHHLNYYQPPDDRDEYPPGDWENPVPVYFLAVPAGVTFEFAVSKRHSDVSDDHMGLAREWLSGALCQLGAGAKTSAGYGAFKIDPSHPETLALLGAMSGTWSAAKYANARAEFTATLELVTPAFLAGAEHEDEAGRLGCDLRPGTLRGHLRWWWRTLHAAHVDTSSLRRMEAAIWGNTKQGGAVRVELSRLSIAPDSIHRFHKRHFEYVSRNDNTGQYGIPNLPNADRNKITPGIGYLAFGMDDIVRDESGQRRPRQRFCLTPPASWRLRLTARSVAGIHPERVLEQVKAALWLLVNYGGVGSRARKGFGSLAASEDLGDTLETCETAAAHFRREFRPPFGTATPRVNCSALDQRIEEVIQDFANWHDVWAVLEQIGFAIQAFAKEHAHEVGKLALGLPRKIGRPKPGRFEPTGPFKSIYENADKSGWSTKPWEKARFASPWHIHLDKAGTAYRVRVTAFVQSTLPNEGESRRFLTQFMEFLRHDLERRSRLTPPISRPRVTNLAASPIESAMNTPPPRSVTHEQVVQKIGELTAPILLFRIERPGNAGEYHGQFLRSAPNIARKYQHDGGKVLTNAQAGLGDGVLVVAEREGNTNRARFLEVFGRLAQHLDRPKGGPRRR